MLINLIDTRHIGAGRAGKSSQSAFTIVELLIVIVVIAILAAITVVAFNGVQNRAEVAVLESDLSQASRQLNIESIEAGAFPADSIDPDALLNSSPGVSYQYSSTGSSFCLTAIKGDKSRYITQNGSPKEGTCDDHTPPIAGGGGSSLTCEPGFIPVPGNSLFGTSDFCVGKYEAKNVGGVAASQAAGKPWDNISQTAAIARASEACDSCHLTSEAEWLTIAHDVVGVASNWSGGSVGSGYIYSGFNENFTPNSLAASSNDSSGYEGTGHSSGAQRRTLTLSNGEVIWDLAGNVWEWTSGKTTGGQPGARYGGSGAWEWRVVEANNNITGNLNPSPFPSYGTPAASEWTSGSNGIGRLFSNALSTSTTGFARGGGWQSPPGTIGVFAFYPNLPPDHTSNQVGFRVAHD